MKKNKTDAKMKFYTGINTIVLFNKIFRLIQPFLSDIIYWKVPKHAKNFSKVRHRRGNTPKKLSQCDEFLLTMMCLRLGLINEDLAERFGVSWPPKESIREHLPEIFLKSGYGKCLVIIDCV